MGREQVRGSSHGAPRSPVLMSLSDVTTGIFAEKRSVDKSGEADAVRNSPDSVVKPKLYYSDERMALAQDPCGGSAEYVLEALSLSGEAYELLLHRDEAGADLAMKACNTLMALYPEKYRPGLLGRSNGQPNQFDAEAEKLERLVSNAVKAMSAGRNWGDTRENSVYAPRFDALKKLDAGLDKLVAHVGLANVLKGAGTLIAPEVSEVLCKKYSCGFEKAFDHFNDALGRHIGEEWVGGMSQLQSGKGRTVTLLAEFNKLPNLLDAKPADDQPEAPKPSAAPNSLPDHSPLLNRGAELAKQGGTFAYSGGNVNNPTNTFNPQVHVPPADTRIASAMDTMANSLDTLIDLIKKLIEDKLAQQEAGAATPIDDDEFVVVIEEDANADPSGSGESGGVDEDDLPPPPPPERDDFPPPPPPEDDVDPPLSNNGSPRVVVEPESRNPSESNFRRIRDNFEQASVGPSRGDSDHRGVRHRWQGEFSYIDADDRAKKNAENHRQVVLGSHHVPLSSWYAANLGAGDDAASMAPSERSGALEGVRDLDLSRPAQRDGGRPASSKSSPSPQPRYGREVSFNKVPRNTSGTIVVNGIEYGPTEAVPFRPSSRSGNPAMGHRGAGEGEVHVGTRELHGKVK